MLVCVAFRFQVGMSGVHGLITGPPFPGEWHCQLSLSDPSSVQQCLQLLLTGYAAPGKVLGVAQCQDITADEAPNLYMMSALLSANTSRAAAKKRESGACEIL